MTCARSIMVGILPCVFYSSSQLFIAVASAIERSSIGNKDAALQSYLTAAAGKSTAECRAIASDILGDPVYWDCDCMEISTQAFGMFDIGTQYLALAKAITISPVELRWNSLPNYPYGLADVLSGSYQAITHIRTLR